MRASRARRKKGFALLELLIALGIVALLSAIAIPRILDRVKKANEAEAVTNLGAIRSAELLLHNLTGKFVAAIDPPAILSALGLMIDGRFYDYKIIDATDENFLALATPIGPLSDWLEEFGIDKDGFVGYSPTSGVTRSGGSGTGGGKEGFTDLRYVVEGGGGVMSGGSSGGVTPIQNAATKPPFTGWAADVQEVINTLLLATGPLTADGAATGKALAEFITSTSTEVKFVPASGMPQNGCAGALGCNVPYTDGTNVIYILDSYKGNKYAAASILGHEALHAIWNKDFADYDYWRTISQPVIGMPTPSGEVRNSYSEDQEYNTFKAGGEIWKDLRTQYPDLVYDDGGLWWEPAGAEKYFVGVPEDEAKGYLTSIYKYNFENKY